MITVKNQILKKYRKSGGTDWYRYRVFLTGEPNELSKIKLVKYYLHESFANPIHVSSDRDSDFEIKLRGWGEYLIKIEIIDNLGNSFHGEYWLDLGFGFEEDKETYPGKIKITE